MIWMYLNFECFFLWFVKCQYTAYFQHNVKCSQCKCKMLSIQCVNFITRVYNNAVNTKYTSCIELCTPRLWCTGRTSYLLTCLQQSAQHSMLTVEKGKFQMWTFQAIVYNHCTTMHMLTSWWQCSQHQWYTAIHIHPCISPRIPYISSCNTVISSFDTVALVSVQ